MLSKHWKGERVAKNNTNAVTIYFSDFLADTGMMSNEEIGAYFRLLMLQNQKGHLEREIIDRTGADKDIILENFVTDENGKFYNEKMEREIVKRNEYAEERQKRVIAKAIRREERRKQREEKKERKESNKEKIERREEKNKVLNHRFNEIILPPTPNGVYTPLKGVEQECLDAYNEICTSMPKAVKLSDKRKQKIRSRLKEYQPEQIRMAFEKAQASDYLSGRSGKWRCDFDWIIDSEDHMTKILEGRYDNVKKTGSIDQARAELLTEAERNGWI